MNIEQWIESYKADERKWWKFTDYIKHNPVLYPRVGDIFLKELFALANPDYEMPYSRRKKVQMDSVWYGVSEETLALYFMGCELAKDKTEELDIVLDNGNRIPFSVYWYLACLFLDEAGKMTSGPLSSESTSRLKKDKTQKGICKPDCRKYYRCVGYTPGQVASDMPVNKNFCPLEQEYSCERKCPMSISVGQKRVEKGMLSFRKKEELLYLFLMRTDRLPAGVLAGELLFDFLVREYAAFGELLKEQAKVNAQNTNVNCQLFNVFAYIADGLCGADWFTIKEGERRDALKGELENNNLWQLLELLDEKKGECRQENALAQILFDARKALEEYKKDLTITPVNP